jgi:DNA-binding response OmpR family regulator
MICAQRSVEIMAWLAVRKFDVYVVDANLADDSGSGICRSIRAVDRDGAVICVSPKSSDRDDMLDAGADLFLNIPESISQLRRTIDDLLDSPKSDSVH